MKECIKRKWFRHFLSALCSIILFCLALTAGPLKVSAKEPPKDLYAISAVLMDGESGRVLFGKKEEEPLANASTTKILTCILMLENCDLSEELTVSTYAESMPKVKLFVKQGEKYRLEDLLFSLMLESHNDSAQVLAEHLGKRYVEDLKDRDASSFTLEESRRAGAAFAALMNQKADRIGCRDSFFITPNGLDASKTVNMPDGNCVETEHHTTARDLALILSYCILQSPGKDTFIRITMTPQHSFCAGDRSFTCVNHNSFLNMMEGAVSGKTGFTGKAGYCYVGALNRDGRIFVVALLGCGWPNNRDYKWKDTRKLMDYGLDHFRRVDLTAPEILYPEERLPTLMVLYGQSEEIGEESVIGLTIPRGELSQQGILLGQDEKVDVVVSLRKEIQAPVTAGEKVGEIRYLVGDQVFRTEDVVTTQEIRKIDLFWCLRKTTEMFLKADFGI